MIKKLEDGVEQFGIRPEEIFEMVVAADKLSEKLEKAIRYTEGADAVRILREDKIDKYSVYKLGASRQERALEYLTNLSNV